MLHPDHQGHAARQHRQPRPAGHARAAGQQRLHVGRAAGDQVMDDGVQRQQQHHQTADAAASRPAQYLQQNAAAASEACQRHIGDQQRLFHRVDQPGGETRSADHQQSAGGHQQPGIFRHIAQSKRHPTHDPLGDPVSGRSFPCPSDAMTKTRHPHSMAGDSVDSGHRGASTARGKGAFGRSVRYPWTRLLEMAPKQSSTYLNHPRVLAPDVSIHYQSQRPARARGGQP